MRDALDHIERLCKGSKTQTVRIQKIALRARYALEGREHDRGDFTGLKPAHNPETMRVAIETQHKRADKAEAGLAEVEAMVVLLEASEWTDTSPKTAIANRLEDALHGLHGELSEARRLVETLLAETTKEA